MHTQSSATFSITEKKEPFADPFALDKGFGSDNIFESKGAIGALGGGFGKNEEQKTVQFKPKTVSLGGGSLF